MSDAEQLRARAATLLALAVRAGEVGASVSADELVKLANELIAQAEMIERREDPLEQEKRTPRI